MFKDLRITILARVAALAVVGVAPLVTPAHADGTPNAVTEALAEQFDRGPGDRFDTQATPTTGTALNIVAEALNERFNLGPNAAFGAQATAPTASAPQNLVAAALDEQLNSRQHGAAAGPPHVAASLPDPRGSTR